VLDSRRYGTFWMSEGALAEAYDLSGAFNSVILTLAPGAETGPVKKELDRILAPYGALVRMSVMRPSESRMTRSAMSAMATLCVMTTARVPRSALMRSMAVSTVMPVRTNGTRRRAEELVW